MKKIIITLLLIGLSYSLYYYYFVYSVPKPSSETVAIVNDISISAVDFKDKLNDIKTNYSADEEVDLSSVKQTILRRMIIETLILQEAKDKNIIVTEDEVKRYVNNIKQSYTEQEFHQILLNQFKTYDSWVEGIRRRLIIEKTLSKVVIDQIDVSEEEIINHFNQFYSEIIIEPKIRLAQIYTYNKTDAEKALEFISAGHSFEEAARNFSKSPEAKDGGLLGNISKGESIEIFDMAFDMKPGEISRIIQSDYGFHILKVLEYIPSRRLSFDDAKPHILNEIIKDKENRIYENWLHKKFINSKIIKNVALIDSIK